MTTKPKARKFRIRKADNGAPRAAQPRPEASGEGAAAPETPEAPTGATGPQAPAGAANSMADVARRRAASLAALKDGQAPRAAQTPRRSAPPEGQPEGAAPAQQPTPATPADAAQPPQTGAARSGEVSSDTEVSAETDIDAIRREGLTGRQLRMARRVAQKYGLAPTSDFDAVRQLRAKGIDPFKPTNMLELVVPGAGSGGAADGAATAQAGVPAKRGKRFPRPCCWIRPTSPRPR